MIETVILNYLNDLDEIESPVYMEVPKNVPSEYYVLEKTGGSIENHICKSTFVIQSYAETLYDAALANDLIKDAMLNGLIEESEIVSVSLNNDYNFTDSATKRYRYQAVFDIVHY